MSALSRPTIGRAAATPAAIALIAVTIIHLIDGRSSLSDVPYIGVLELALAATCMPLALLLLMRPTIVLWRSVLVVTGAAMLAFVLSRSVGLPGSTDDIGNWSQTLGVLSLVTELACVGIAASVLRGVRLRSIAA